MADKIKKFTDKQRKFINEYLIDLNATQAAIRAGYSKKTAQRMGSENLLKPVIKGEIAEKQQKLALKTEISQERVLQEEKCLAFYDPAMIFELENGSAKHPNDIPENVRRAISDIRVTEKKDDDGNIVQFFKYKFLDKGKALERISKHLGLYEKDNKHILEVENKEWKLIIQDANSDDQQ